MSNIRDVHCKLRLGVTWNMVAMLCVITSFFRRLAHVPAIHAASHVDHEKRVAWFSMHASGSVPIATGLRLPPL